MKKGIFYILLCTCLNLEIKAQDTLIMPITGNGGFYNTCNAIIYDNGADTNYANFSHSTITIAPLWVQTISLFFEEFNTEIHFDSLNIFDGPGITFPLLGTYSGNALQGQTITSTGNAITLEFRSDDIQTGTGFKARISCLVDVSETHESSIVLYPNPAADFLQVDGVELEKIVSISVYDALGHAVKYPLVSNSLNVSFLPPGFYGLGIQLLDGKTMYKKWVKI